MRTIRTNVFETNSSSTHSIAVPNHKVPWGNSMWFELGEFGWDQERVDPADYLYTAIFQSPKREEYLTKLKTILDNHHIEYSFDTDPTHQDYCYIDHSYKLNFFLDELFRDDERVLNFIFGGEVFTGNDNEDDGGFLSPDKQTLSCWDEEVEDYVSKPNPYYNPKYLRDFEFYYKGN